jgi:hypothetical protein
LITPSRSRKTAFIEKESGARDGESERKRGALCPEERH